MATTSELKHEADEALFSNQYERALRLYMQIVEAQPLHLDARLRIADALLALGEVQRAAVVYVRLAQYTANAGYPLRALTALKILGALEPELRSLVRSVSELYGKGSPKLGRGVRRSLPGDEPLPRRSHAPEEALSNLVVHAEKTAADYSHGEAFFPDKLMPIPLLSSLDQDELGRVFDICGLLRVRPGVVIAEQGSHGRSMYILARGSVRVLRKHGDEPPLQLAILQEGTAFGELSFLSGTARSAAVVAQSDCDVLELSWEALEPAGDALQHLRKIVSDFARERLLAHVMSKSPLFAPFDPLQRLDLIKRFDEIEVEGGTEIVRQGQPSDGAYVVLRGEVAVRRSEGERSAELARLGSGELFGEMSLLAHSVANATVYATEPTVLLRLARPYFERLVEALPDLRAELEQLAGRRSREIASSFVPNDPDLIDVEVLL
jgi:CRP-like cAMP-binding protein